MKIFFSVLLIAFAIQATLQAEIQTVTLRWTAQLCQGNCMELLTKEFRKIQGVEEFNIDQGSGEATIKWKERIPFQYSAVNTAMRMVGLSIRNIRIQVKGTIRHAGDTFYIVSNGDYTRFDLLNPVIPNTAGVTAEFNAAARKLTPALQQQLLNGEAQKLDVVIEGPIFMPERNTIPTQIVLDHLNFIDPKKDQEAN